MTLTVLRCALLGAVGSLALCLPGHAQSIDAEAPLIERARLFSDNTRYDAELSPDAAHFAFSAPWQGVPNIWLAEVGAEDQARPVTQSTAQGVPGFLWSRRPGTLLLIGDANGDERWRISRLDLMTGEIRPLTPGQGERAQILGFDPEDPEYVILSSNARDAQAPDVFRVGLTTGAQTEVLHNRWGYESFSLDAAGEVRLARRTDQETGDYAYDRVESGEPAGRFLDVAYADTRGFQVLGFAATGREVFLLDSSGRDTRALIAMDLQSGTRTVLAEDPLADVTEVVMDPVSGLPLAWASDYADKQWRALDEHRGRIFERFTSDLKGRVDFHAWSADGRHFTAYVSGAEPAYYVRGDVETGELSRLMDVYPDLAGLSFTAKQAEIIPTRDGAEMVAWMTLPHGADEDGDGRPDQPVPLVVMPHGGPWDQSRNGFDPWQQWLANRGYAVLSPNFRGSTGYGKAWLNGGDLEWGGRIQADVEDAVHWAVEAGIADAGRVGIMGASFGGYLAMRGLTETPDLYACASSGSGPVNLITLYESLPEYWGAFLGDYRRRVGNPLTEEGRALLTAHSPLFGAQKIRRPLLLGQGSEDSRVPPSEAEQIVAAMQANEQPVTYMLFEQEGHGARRPANIRASMAITEAFFANCLGGRVEPFGNALDGSTLVLPYGAEFVPGLTEAYDSLQVERP